MSEVNGLKGCQKIEEQKDGMIKKDERERVQSRKQEVREQLKLRD
jgi:hypothetical protein